MKISARRSEDGAFTLKFDQTEVVLGMGDLKRLVMQVSRLLTPESMNTEGAVQQEAVKLAEIIKGADDIGVQALIQAAEEDDILVLLKLGEEDEALLDKLYGNMSEKVQTMFEEDLSFKFGDSVPDGPAKTSIRNLNHSLRTLARDGRFTLPADG